MLPTTLFNIYMNTYVGQQKLIQYNMRKDPALQL